MPAQAGPHHGQEMAQHVAVGVQDADGGNAGIGNSLLPARLAQQIFRCKRRRCAVMLLREDRRDSTRLTDISARPVEPCSLPILVAVLTDVRQARLTTLMG